MRDEDREKNVMVFKAHKTQGSFSIGRGNSSCGRGHANPYQICGRNNHTAIS